jgi:hypothetical protein
VHLRVSPIRCFHAINVTVADAREADVGPQSADTIKLNFIRCRCLGIARGGSAGLPAGRSSQGNQNGRLISRATPMAA